MSWAETKTVWDRIDSAVSTLSSTLSTMSDTLSTINTNAARLTSARAIIIDNIGATGNTGGSSTAGTVMAKLNALITTLSTVSTNISTSVSNTASSGTTASSNGTLSQKLSYIISTGIGSSGQTPADQQTGTVMSKLNALISLQHETTRGTTYTAHRYISSETTFTGISAATSSLSFNFKAFGSSSASSSTIFSNNSKNFYPFASYTFSAPSTGLYTLTITYKNKSSGDFRVGVDNVGVGSEHRYYSWYSDSSASNSYETLYYDLYLEKGHFTTIYLLSATNNYPTSSQPCYVSSLNVTYSIPYKLGTTW